MSNFFAYISRMKLIRRWSLMRNIQEENIQEHSMETAVFAHALAEIGNAYFQESYDANYAAVLALYHDVGEVIIGDLPTPVKYFNPQIKQAYGEIEDVAKHKLLSFLPGELQEAYRPLFFADRQRPEYRLVKAADKLSAYVKCLEECAAGNGEFLRAKESVFQGLAKYQDIPAVQWFMDHCLDAYSKTLDELD